MRASMFHAVLGGLCLLGMAAYGQQTQAVRGGGGIPPLVNFSGALRDGAGKPLIGQEALTFSLYAGPDSRTPLWQETQNVEADDQGHYTVHLGAATASGMPTELFTSGQSLWLGVQPHGAGAVEQSRVLLVSVPYALKAGDADTLGGRPASAYLTRDVPAGTAGSPAANSKDAISAAAAIGGAGTANYIPLWTDGADIGNSLLFQSGANLGLGTTTPSARLQLISPAAATKGLIVGAAPSQTANLQEWQNSGGTALGYVNKTGGAFFPAAGIGSTGPQTGSTLYLQQDFGNPAGSSVSGISALPTMAPTAASVANFYGGNVSATISGAIGTTGQVYGLYGRASSSVASGGLADTLVGGRFSASNTSTGAVNSLYGGLFSAYNQGGGAVTNQAAGYFYNSVSGNSQVTNLYGNFILAPTITGATVTNAYGLYVQKVTGGTTRNYSIYSAGGTNYFGGNVGIGTLSPSAVLHVMGPKAGANANATAALIVQGAQGGDGGNADAGNGASITLIAGNGGNGGMITGGGGSITLQPGFGGTGGLTNAGPGALLLAPGGGSVGIGTSSPAYTLDVNGNARFGGAVTFGQGISTSGQVASSIAPGTPPLLVSSSTQVANLNASYLNGLTANAFAKVTSNNTFTANEFILGYLGVGTVAPAFPIHNVGGDATGKGVQTRTSNISTSGNSFASFSATGNNGAVVNQLAADGLGSGLMGTPGGYFGTFTNHPTALVSNNTERMRLTTDGKILLLTNAPYQDPQPQFFHDGASPVQIITNPQQGADGLLVVTNASLTNAIEGLALAANSYAIAGMADSPNSTAVYGEAYRENLNDAPYSCNSCAGTFEGNSDVQGDLYVNGAVSNNFDTLVIDHPVKPASQYLAHAYVSSSEMINVYEGNVVTDATGRATVTLPEYVQAMNHDFRYQLTVLGQFAQAIVEQEMANNQFTIRTDKPGVKVSWHVTGVRQDAWASAHPLLVEREKPALEQGHYLHPELFGAREEMGIHWAHHPQRMKQMQARRAASLAAHQTPAPEAAAH